MGIGDLDSDGDPDLVVSHLSDPPALLRNDSQRAGNVLQLKIIGARTARRPLGIRVEVVVGDQIIAAHIPSGECFQASHDDRLLVPIGSVVTVEEVRVNWPSGQSETWTGVSSGKLRYLIEGNDVLRTMR